MSNLSQFFGGSGNGPVLSAVPILSSQSYTVKRTGKVRITGCGPGGSGAGGRATSNRVTGGAAGGVGMAVVSVTEGDVIDVVIGAPGAGLASLTAAGNAGGTTTVTLLGVTRYLYGGGGGSLTGVGAEGGDAVGWDVGYKGGGSGASTAEGAATGGGAVNLFGKPVAEVSSGNASGNYSASGGASPGGKSADVSSINSASGGGGVGGGSVGIAGGAPVFFEAFLGPLRANGGGGRGLYSVTTPSSSDAVNENGGASGGAVVNNTGATVASTSGDAGAFAGSGAAVVSNAGTTKISKSGTPGIGAGSGGAFSGTINQQSTADGGVSIVIIEEL